MSNERYSNTEFQNTLDTASNSDMPRAAKDLIAELFERVKALEEKADS